MPPKTTKATTPKPENEHDLREDLALDEADAEIDDDVDWNEEDNEPDKGYFLLKVELQNTPTPVWRRLIISDKATLDDLDQKILIAFDWDEDMPTSFYKDDKCKQRLSINDDGYMMHPNPPLSQVITPGKTLGYEITDLCYKNKCNRCLITVEKLVQNKSELKNIVKGQGNPDDMIPEQFFLLKVQLLGFKPPIWRRILISNKARFSELHDAIQEKFGWDDDHLAGFFESKGYQDEICITEDYPGDFYPNPKLYRYLRVGESLGYIFDFGDDWRHWITVEKAVADKSELPKKLIWAKGDNVPQYPDSYYDEDEDED